MIPNLEGASSLDAVGGWAILVGLFLEYRRRGIYNSATLRPKLLKEEVVRVASRYTNASFTREAGAKGFYTAWDSHKTLTSHKLLESTKRPNSYWLTDAGFALAERLVREANLVDEFEQPDEAALVAASDANKENRSQSENSAEPHSEPSQSSCSPDIVAKPSLFGNRRNREPVAVSSLDSYKLVAASTEVARRELSAPVAAENRSASDAVLSVDLLTHTISEIVLLVDNREKGRRARCADAAAIVKSLKAVGVVQCGVRQLQLGDFLWVGRTTAGVEVVLDCVAERKKIPDLVSSIVDKRYKEQKFRLAKSGVENVIYLVEGEYGDGSREYSRALDEHGLEAALASTEVSDEFCVVRTASAEESWNFLASTTSTISNRWKGKSIYTMRTDQQQIWELKSSAPTTTVVSQGQRVAVSNIFCTIDQFNTLSSKSQNSIVTDLFAQQLMAVRRRRRNTQTHRDLLCFCDLP